MYLRYVPARCLLAGMVIAKDLYGNDNRLMLKNGSCLSQNEINRIKALGFQGVYIHDDVSRDIEVREVINTQLKNNTVKAIKTAFLQPEGTKIKDIANVLTGLNQMMDKIILEILDSKDSTINMLDLKTFDEYTYQHSVNVAVLSIAMGVALGLPHSRLSELGISALLHDIGKVFIPKEILDKAGKLTEEEYEVIKEHSALGSKYLKDKWTIPLDSVIAILNHHERYDGTGYPYQLKNEKISEYGKILAISDVYDALTSNRVYRQAFSPSEGLEYIMGGSGIMFDPFYVNVFTKLVVPYPVGCSVQLSNGQMGLVMENYTECILRPKIKIIHGKDTQEYLDLAHDPNLLNITVLGLTDMNEHQMREMA